MAERFEKLIEEVQRQNGASGRKLKKLPYPRFLDSWFFSMVLRVNIPRRRLGELLFREFS